MADVEKVRQSSKAKDTGPWASWWDEMARKTVIRRIAKRLPSSADVDQVFEHDNEASGFVQSPSREPVDITPAPAPENGPSRLKQAIAEQTVEEATNANADD